jgi:hypothetical protein
MSALVGVNMRLSGVAKEYRQQAVKMIKEKWSSIRPNWEKICKQALERIDLV